MEQTIEERAYKAVPDVLRINDSYLTSFVVGYTRGATEQAQLCADWLRTNLKKYCKRTAPMEKIIEDFLNETK